MTPPAPGGAPLGRYRELVDGLLSETLSPDELRQLEQHLDGNPRLQQHFRSYCQLHIDLTTDVRSEEVVDRVLQFLTPVSEKRATLRTTSLATRRTSAMLFYGGVTAGLLLLSVVILTQFQWRHAIGHRAHEGEGPIHNDVISVKLISNETKSLPISDVGTVLIQGPAHFEMIGKHRARLHQGRIKVRIPDSGGGHGFVLETPRGHVTDLGTEYGVDVGKDSSTDLFVFEGKLDLTLPDQNSASGLQVQRLIQGEGLSLQHSGQFGRIMSVVTGHVATFQRHSERAERGSLITNVTDNIRAVGFHKFYEIVPGGLREDALAYADRPEHDWNGVDQRGMPEYLLGADYVKPFNSDKMRGDVEISVTLARPARLLVFFDRRVTAPEWLQQDFRNTGDVIGLDLGKYEIDGVVYDHVKRNFGPGNSIQHTFAIWEMIVDTPRVVRLGPNQGSSELSAMYGIAAVPYEPTDQL